MVKRLVISGDILKDFINTLLFPTEEERIKMEKLRKERSQYITIHSIDNGFIAEINNLDLSFLDN